MIYPIAVTIPPTIKHIIGPNIDRKPPKKKVKFAIPRLPKIKSATP